MGWLFIGGEALILKKLKKLRYTKQKSKQCCLSFLTFKNEYKRTVTTTAKVLSFSRKCYLCFKKRE